MATQRLVMRKIREILRLKWCENRSHRETARILAVGVGTVGGLMVRAQHAGLSWSEAESLTDAELELRVYGLRSGGLSAGPEPDPARIHKELSRPGVTLELLHLEYLNEHPKGFKYTAFCDRYRKWKKSQRISMRQTHRSGEKLFVDYSGKKPSVVNAETGEVTEVELFVGTLGASGFTFIEATQSQKSADWLGSHIRCLEYFRGAPKLFVPDQLRSGVSRPCRYEPGPQRSYGELARHYGAAVLPARPRKPKDKAKVERAVLAVQRWVLACIRNEVFYSIGHLNLRLRQLLERFNDKPMRTYGGKTRREMFERYDLPYLQPLPARPYEYGEWKGVTVNIDYHVEVDGHYYSVPHVLLGKRLEAWSTQKTVEIYRGNDRLASHPRSYDKGQHTTIKEHMPVAHRAHLEWSPSRLIRWGASIGPQTEALVNAILTSKPHPEMGYRSCLGILRLEKRYGRERLELAAERSNAVNATSYRHVAAVLKNKVDALPPPLREPQQQELPLIHENLRGSDYYH